MNFTIISSNTTHSTVQTDDGRVINVDTNALIDSVSARISNEIEADIERSTAPEREARYAHMYLLEPPNDPATVDMVAWETTYQQLTKQWFEARDRIYRERYPVSRKDEMARQYIAEALRVTVE